MEANVRYMLLIYKDEKARDKVPQPAKDALLAEVIAYNEALAARGIYQGGDRLEPSSTGATVRMKHGKVLMTDGPFAETKEHLGGYNIVEAKTLDDALALAAANPLVLAGSYSIEVRPLRDRRYLSASLREQSAGAPHAADFGDNAAGRNRPS